MSENKNIETEIRKALDVRAHEVEVPEGLATRTVGLAREQTRGSLRDRVRAWRDAFRLRRGGAVRTGYPRWLLATGAAAAAVMLFAVGMFVTGPRDGGLLESKVDSTGGDARQLGAPDAEIQPGDNANDTGQAGEAKSGDAVGGRVEGVVGSDPSVDATNRDRDVGIEPAPQPARPGTFPPKVIRSAAVQVEVKSFDRAWGRANDIASRHGGFVTNSQTEQLGDDRARGTVTMRVPAKKLDAALADLRALGSLEQMRTSGEDVSAVIADVKARVKVLETEELQLLELMRRAANLSETLEVRERLDSTRQEIESLKAQQRSYEDQVDFSTINATIFEEGVSPDDDGDGIIPQAWDTALRIGLTIVAGTVVVLGGLVPLAVLGIAVWLVVRALRRRRTTP